MEVNTTIIDDKIYVEEDTITVNDKTYAYLVNDADEFDFCIKLVEGEEYTAIKDKDEFDLALMYFVKKHVKDLENQGK